MPMCRSCALPAPGFISSTRKPARSWARRDARLRPAGRHRPFSSDDGPHLPGQPNGPRLKVHFCTISRGTYSAAVRNWLGGVTDSNG
jgi:hypothetical protein